MEYEEDAHFCLKCHSTILGLESYVEHRKSATCRKPPQAAPSKSALGEAGPEAADFFSSLELRSSALAPVAPPPGKPGGILTRSKSKSGKNVWIGGNQLKDLGTGDNQSKLIKAVANLERRKEAPPRLPAYPPSDDESEASESEEDETSDEDQPPQGHTGGKWKPRSPPARAWSPAEAEGTACPVCHARVQKPLMGKHLVSHQHCSRGDAASPANRQLVLDNILAVVLQSPFQCQQCQFYCNTPSQFGAHWRSRAHLQAGRARPPGPFRCDSCRHEAPTSAQMLAHLESPEHQGAARAPTCIRRLQDIPCACGRVFRLHRQRLNHARLHCGRCAKVLGSARALQQHLRRAHRHAAYFCSACDLRFASAAEAAKHRLSVQHR